VSLPGASTDQAALLGVGLAATISISASDGPWELIESCIGAALLLLIQAFYRPDQRSSGREIKIEAVAAAGVKALCICLILAFFIQQVFHPSPFWLANLWLPVVFGVSTASIYLLRKGIPRGRPVSAQD
jgi:peptidoglycan/LPS O-acetylase OafA/YrhL